MPARGSYEVTPSKEDEVAEQDQSYGRCIIALLTCFFLCMILILSTWLLGAAKTAPITDSRNNNDCSEKLEYRGNKFEIKTEDPDNTVKEFEPDFAKQKDDKHMSFTENPQKKNIDPVLTDPIHLATTSKSDTTDSITEKAKTVPISGSWYESGSFHKLKHGSKEFKTTTEDPNNTFKEFEPDFGKQKDDKNVLPTENPQKSNIDSVLTDPIHITTTLEHDNIDHMTENYVTMISPTTEDYSNKIISTYQTKNRQALIQDSKTKTASPNPHDTDDSIVKNDTMMNSTTTYYTKKIIFTYPTKHKQALIQDTKTKTASSNPHDTDNSTIKNDTMMNATTKDYPEKIIFTYPTKHRQALIEDSKPKTASPNPHDTDDSIIKNDTMMNSTTTYYTKKIISTYPTKHKQALIQDTKTKTASSNPHDTDNSTIKNDTMMNATTKDYPEKIIFTYPTKHRQALIEDSKPKTASPNPHDTDDSIIKNDTMMNSTTTYYTKKIISTYPTKHRQTVIQDTKTKTASINPQNTDDSVLKNDTMMNSTTKDYPEKIIFTYPTKHRQALIEDSKTKIASPNSHDTDDSIIKNDTMMNSTTTYYTKKIISTYPTKHRQTVIQDTKTKTASINPQNTDDSVLKNDTMMNSTTKDYPEKIIFTYPTKHRQALIEDSKTKIASPNSHDTDDSIIKNDTMMNSTTTYYTKKIISTYPTKHRQTVIQDTKTKTASINPHNTDDSILKNDTMMNSTTKDYPEKIIFTYPTKHRQALIEDSKTKTASPNPHDTDDSIIKNDTMMNSTTTYYTKKIISTYPTKHRQTVIEDSKTKTASPNPHDTDDSIIKNDTMMNSTTTYYTKKIISTYPTKHRQTVIQDTKTKTASINPHNTDDFILKNDTLMNSTTKDYPEKIIFTYPTKHRQALIEDSKTKTASLNPHDTDDSIIKNDTMMNSTTTYYTKKIISTYPTKHRQALIQNTKTKTISPNPHDTDDSTIKNDTMMNSTTEYYTKKIISTYPTKHRQALIEDSKPKTASPNPHDTDDSIIKNDTMMNSTTTYYTKKIISTYPTKHRQTVFQDTKTKTSSINPHNTDDFILKNDTMMNSTTKDYPEEIIFTYPTKHRQSLIQNTKTKTASINPHNTDDSIIKNDTMMNSTTTYYTKKIISAYPTKHRQALIQNTKTKTASVNPHNTDDSIIKSDRTMISPTTEDYANKIMSKDHTEDRFETSTLSIKTTATSTVVTETESTTVGYDEKERRIVEANIKQQINSISKNNFTEKTKMQSITSDSYMDQPTTISNDNDISQTTNGFTSSATTIDSSDANVPVTTTTKQSICDNVSNNIIDKDKQDGQCTTLSCKQLASKMFLYMNPSVDACDDFYEYACGGLEDDSEILGKNLLNRAYQRIENEMRKGKNVESRLFFKYYDSCVKYDETIERSERTKMVIDVLKSIGKFYTSENQNDDDPDITDLFRKLFIHNSALLFDILPDVDEFASNRFTLKIGPPISKSPFVLEDPDDPCNPTKEKLHGDNFDLNSMYKMYIDCKRGIKPIADAIKESITIMASDMLIENIPQFIDSIVHDIDIELIQGFLVLYPSDQEVRQAYVSKNYSMMTLEKLESTNDVINWTALISSLINNNNTRDMQLQVYFENQLIKGMQNLKDFAIRRGLKALNNALLGLYARNLYQELIVPKPRHSKRQCLRAASSLMEFEASSLYISSFSKEEIERMNTTIIEMFHELKFTLKLNFEDAEWLNDTAKAKLLGKLEHMKIIIPNILLYQHSRGLKPNLTDNYFTNTISLMKNYRSSMYNEHMYQNPRDPQAIWTNFAVPFQTQAVTIYGLNTVIIPFGVIDWTVLPKGSEILKSFDYLLFATLGNVIAREISHHFDSIGMYYDGNKRDMEYMIINEDGSSVITFDIYTSCHKVSYPDPINVTVRSLNHTASFKVSELSLNERLSDIMGLRLVYDTLSRINWANQMPLPWLNLNVKQLFYLAFAQTHCTKLPLTSSYRPDYHVPSRVRIFISASSEPLLGNAWSCMPGTNVVPADTCPVFPKLVNDANSEPTRFTEKTLRHISSMSHGRNAGRWTSHSSMSE